MHFPLNYTQMCKTLTGIAHLIEQQLSEFILGDEFRVSSFDLLE